MKLMKYLLKSYCPFGRTQPKLKVGFIIPSYRNYSRVMPSTRIRVYDIIEAFKKHSDYKLSIYNRFNKFDVVIFQKLFNEKSYQKAVQLKEKGTEIILDINVNYYDKSSNKISQQQYETILKFTTVEE